jgi:hypothetical protein
MSVAGGLVYGKLLQMQIPIWSMSLECDGKGYTYSETDLGTATDSLLRAGEPTVRALVMASIRALLPCSVCEPCDADCVFDGVPFRSNGLAALAEWRATSVSVPNERRCFLRAGDVIMKTCRSSRQFNTSRSELLQSTLCQARDQVKWRWLARRIASRERAPWNVH